MEKFITPSIYNQEEYSCKNIYIQSSSDLFCQLTQVDLQWFGKADDEGRTEDPTESKLKKSRKEGKVAKSQDLTSAVILLLAIITLAIFGKFVLREIGAFLNFFLIEATEFDLVGHPNLMALMFVHFAKIMIPFFGIVFVAAFLGNVLQVGFLFSTKPITPDFKKIMPKFGEFFKRSFFSRTALFNLVKALIKVVIIFVIVGLNLYNRMQTILGLVNQSIWEGFSFLAQSIFTIMIEVSLFLLVFSIPDFFFQRKEHRENLKMTKKDIKDEYKEQEGDPLVKAKLKNKMKELLSNNMIRNVPEADVIITNPTHYAVALKYDPLMMSAPVVIAKGEDHLALRIRSIARESNVPLMENKPLAQALYKEIEPGEEIPTKYYEAIAVILDEVYKMTDREEEAV